MNEINRSVINRDNTIKDIKHAFMRLYREMSLQQITVKAICDMARVSRTVFYRYFDDKYAVFEAIENDFVEKIKELNTGSASKNLETYLINVMSWVHENQFYLQPFYEKPESSRILFQWNRNIQKGLLPLLNIDTKNVENLDKKLAFATAGYVGLFTDWVIKQPSTSPEEMAKITVELIRKTII